MNTADLLELLLLARRNIDLGAILHVRTSHHCPDAGTTASDHSCPLWLTFCRTVLHQILIRTYLSFHIEEIGYSEI
jgi:hypothetical protein